MIVIAGSIPVKAETRAEAVAAAIEMGVATRLEEGCLAYRFYSDLDDPNTIFVFEEWENEEALTAHFQTDHMAEFRKKLPQLVAGKGAIKKYIVESSSDL